MVLLLHPIALVRCILYTIYLYFCLYVACRKLKKSGAGSIILTAVPEHSNIGDLTIMLAEEQFFAEMLPEKDCIVICRNLFVKYHQLLAKYIRKDHIFAFHGGGNLGSLHREAGEDVLRIILKNFSGII